MQFDVPIFLCGIDYLGERRHPSATLFGIGNGPIDLTGIESPILDFGYRCLKNAESPREFGQ